MHVAPMNTSARVFGLLCALALTACNRDAAAPAEAPMPAAPSEAGSVDAGLQALLLPSPVDEPVRYRCADFEFSARYDENEVVLLLAAGPRVLTQVIAASGAKYEGEDAMLWSKGSTAELELDGEHHADCREQQIEVPRPQTPGFVARGNEPGWSLEIVPGDRMTLLADYGDKKIETPAPPALEDNGAIVYHARTGKHELSVRIEPTPCTDDMSGQLFATTVVVRLDGRELRGCGGKADAAGAAPTSE